MQPGLRGPRVPFTLIRTQRKDHSILYSGNLLAIYGTVNSTMEQAHLFFLEDEQYAKDLQVAYDLHAREERRAQRRLDRERQNKHEPAEIGDGFVQGAVNADHMLFVSCTMDSHLVPMLVDTGASTSAMSREVRSKLLFGVGSFGSWRRTGH